MKEGESSFVSVLPAPDNAAELSVVETPTQKEELDRELQQKREQLLLLRRQQEELERQKNDIEELRRKHEEYARGKTEMIDQFTRGLVLLEREQVEAQRRVELCMATRQSFREHLEKLHALRDDQWTSANIRVELSAALGVIESARMDYHGACARLDCLKPPSAAAKDASSAGTGVGEFRRYVRLGFAASLPLIVVGTIWLIVFLLAKR